MWEWWLWWGWGRRQRCPEEVDGDEDSDDDSSDEVDEDDSNDDAWWFDPKTRPFFVVLKNGNQVLCVRPGTSLTLDEMIQRFKLQGEEWGHLSHQRIAHSRRVLIFLRSLMQRASSCDKFYNTVWFPPELVLSKQWPSWWSLSLQARLSGGLRYIACCNG